MLSLPPKVTGRVNGHLVMKVDEVIWSQKPVDDVLAVVMWWGGETATTFRPVNIARYAALEDTTDVVYEIRTSLPLFEKYLQKCGTLRIVVTDKKGAPIGIVRIPDIYQVIQASPIENYFPIVTSSETRIGDLHVVFQLIKSKQSSLDDQLEKNAANVNNAKSGAVFLPDPLHTTCDLIHQQARKTVRNSSTLPLNSAAFRSRNTLVSRGKSRDVSYQSHKRNIHKTVASDPEGSQKTTDSCCANKKKLSCDDLDDVFSEILERGQKLQKAITLSVIKDEMSGIALSDPMVTLHSHSDFTPPLDTESRRCSAKPMTADTELSDKSDCATKKPVSKEDKNKVICYLQGKSMSAKEETEALEILRGMSPTEGFLHELKDYCMKPLPEQSKALSTESSTTDESSHDDGTVKKSASKSSIKPTGWLPLHKVSCVRLSVIKVVLNAVGLRRVNASFPSKGLRLPVSGLTFFVEYKWPLSNTSSRPWAENVSRFCSKRQVNDEVLFNDSAVHSVSSLSSQDAANVLVTLLSKVAFRVCARQLKQRDPVVLGEASLSSISDLLGAASLSQEFLAPVIAPDSVFVALLNVRVELGRDRVHFGGPPLPSPQNSLQKTSDDSDFSNAGQTGGDGPKTDSIPAAKTSRERVEVRLNVGSSDKHTSCNRPTYPTAQPSAQPPKTPADAQIETHSTHPNLPTSVSQQTVNTKLAPAKKDPKLIAKSKFGYVNHDLAITVQRISDCKAVAGISPQNVHFIIAYRFPSWDVTKLTTIDWQDFSTDPAMCKGDLHFFGANHVHSSLLPGSETFLSFLRDALEVRGADSNEGIEFILFFRSYFPKISDTPTAMALLPLDTIAMLEAAFVDAAASNANFTESSCASVMMDLPLHRVRTNVVLANEPPIGILHLKLDYRHTCVRPVQREGSGDSQAEPLGLPEEKLKIHPQDSLPHLLKHPWSLPPNIQTVNTVHVPNIAVAIQKIGKVAEKCPVWLGGPGRKHPDRSRRIETVFVTDPSDSFGSDLEKVEELKYRRHRHEEYESSSEDSVPKKRVHSGTVTEDRTESLSIGVQTSPIRGSADLSVEVDVAEPVPFRTEPRDAVKVCDASTSTDSPGQNCRDQELQTCLPGRAAGCQTTESLTHLTEENAKGTKHGLTGTKRVEDSAEPKSKAAERASVDIARPGDPERRHTVELKRRGATSVVQSRRPTLEKAGLATEPDEGVASGDKPVTSSANETRRSAESRTAIPSRVEVECALHLPENEHANSVTFVTVHTDRAESGQEILRTSEQLMTPPVASATDVHWNWSCQLDLPVALFLEEDRRLIFKVWQRKGKENSAGVLGSAALDLTVLAAGLPVIDGWFNILDISGISQGQIKVLVAPQQEACERILPRRPAAPSSAADKKAPQRTEPTSLYVAQGMYRKFPSHLSHYDDILVQKVQNILGLSDAFSQESSKRSDQNASQNASVSLPDEIVSASAPKDSSAEEAPAPLQPDRRNMEALVLLNHLEDAEENNAADANAGNEVGASLRDTLTELERLTSKMRERIRSGDFRGSYPSSEDPRSDARATGAVPKQKSRSPRRPSALDRVNAWECTSTDPDSPKRFRKPEKNLTDPKSRPHRLPLWEDRAEDRESTPIAEDQDLSEWIADAAMREMMNVRLFSPLFFPDIVVVPQAPSYRGQEVKVIEIDDTNEARFAEDRGWSDNSTPIHCDRVLGRVRSPVDSGVDVESSNLSRGKKKEERREEQRASEDCCFEQPCSVGDSRRSSDEQPSGEVTLSVPQSQPGSSPRTSDLASGQHQTDGEHPGEEAHGS